MHPKTNPLFFIVQSLSFVIKTFFPLKTFRLLFLIIHKIPGYYKKPVSVPLEIRYCWKNRSGKMLFNGFMPSVKGI